MCPCTLNTSPRIQTSWRKGVWLDSFKGLFVFLEEIKRSSLLFGFPQNHCIPNPPIAQTYVSVWGGFSGGKVKKVMIDWGHKRRRSKCVALNLQPSLNHTLTDPRGGLPQLVLKSMLARRALNRKSSKLYYVRIYEPFQNINSALFEVSVKDSSYS